MTSLEAYKHKHYFDILETLHEIVVNLKQNMDHFWLAAQKLDTEKEPLKSVYNAIPEEKKQFFLEVLLRCFVLHPERKSVEEFEPIITQCAQEIMDESDTDSDDEEEEEAQYSKEGLEA